MCSATETEENRCPHCGAEPGGDDDLCRFCGKVRELAGQVKRASWLRSLKPKIRPMTSEEIDETLISADYGNPANPIWDD